MMAAGGFVPGPPRVVILGDDRPERFLPLMPAERSRRIWLEALEKLQEDGDDGR